MFPITSIYIPYVDKSFNAEFIANTIEKNGIAKVSSIAIEPYKSSYVSIVKNGIAQYNRVYIGIKSWQDTEAAYNFIYRLRNSNRETRLIYNDDDWWRVEINYQEDKLLTNNDTSRVVTLFEDLTPYDYGLTYQLKKILSDFKRKQEMELEREFESYIHEMDEERALWFSEQYIYDALGM